MESVLQVHGITPVPFATACTAVGIGDILFGLLNVQQGLYPLPYQLTLHNFTHFFPNPANALNMRLALLKDLLLHHETLPRDGFQVIRRATSTLDLNYPRLETLHLKLKDSYWEGLTLPVDISGEYIIFHTKLRLRRRADYNSVKQRIAEFCARFTTSRTIVLLGEQDFPSTREGNIHGIQTIYKELSLLKEKNTVIDLTVKEIYNSLDYSAYKRDLFLIKNAACNVCIGMGGQLVSSLVFGKVASCAVIEPPSFQPATMERDGHKIFLGLDELFSHLRSVYADSPGRG